jgi:tRNA threonylcarbamoyl adenosine modification protein YeaZ
MLTLGINTASSSTSIALLQNGALLGESSWESHNNEAEKLMPAIAELCDDLTAIDQVIVISGPGSFTGLRVGVTVANTIAYLNKCELYAVDTFDYWWAKDVPAKELLIFAGRKGVYVNKDGKTELTPLDEVKVEGPIFGDITEEQKKEIGAEFIQPEETFGQTLEKLAKNLKEPVKIVKPNYIKNPEITKPKKQCSI